MAQNMKNIDFRTFFTVTSQQWSLLKENCDFFFEKMHKVFKNKAQGCCTPVNVFDTFK